MTILLTGQDYELASQIVKKYGILADADQSSYYDDPVRATIGGSVISLLVFLILLLIGAGVFAHKRKIES